MMIKDWTDATLLIDPVYLNQITSGIYIMEANPHTPNQLRIRIGAFGYRRTCANDRLKQVNTGAFKRHAVYKHCLPFKFAFLAPMPDDLGHNLRVAECLLQNSVAAACSGLKGSARILPITLPLPTLLQIATNVTLCFLKNRYAGSAHALAAALSVFNSTPSPFFFQDPSRYSSAKDFLAAEKAREKVFAEAQKVFDTGLANALLYCLTNKTIPVAGQSPCNEIDTYLSPCGIQKSDRPIEPA